MCQKSSRDVDQRVNTYNTMPKHSISTPECMEWEKRTKMEEYKRSQEKKTRVLAVLTSGGIMGKGMSNVKKGMSW